MGSRTHAEASIVDALRRYGVAATEVSQAFSGIHDLQQSDLHALMAIMDADRAGSPLTPTALRARLHLSSGGTTYVIDRLERAGHVRREPSATDRRAVHLRHTDTGMSTALAFFGPLGERTTTMLSQFDDAELAVVDRFIDGALEALREHLGAIADPGRADQPGAAPPLRTT